MTERQPVDVLTRLAQTLLEDAAMPATRARLVAEILVEADLLGHTTHGLQLLPAYLRALAEGSMRATGEVEIVADTGATQVWNGRRLSGVWLTAAAVDDAVARAATHGIAAVAIRESHHIACLAAYLERATATGAMVTILSSDPAARSVAPYGGRTPVMTPNPIAIGIPTDADPVLIDVSASITTNGMSSRLAAKGERFAHPWLLDGAGRATDDPAALDGDPPGSILPVGGLDHGHKGFALGLWVEAMTQALAGFGRADAPVQWGASVHVQVVDPRAFAGADAFVRQTGWLARACAASEPAAESEGVRLPGARGLANKRAGLARGVALHPGILEGLREAAAARGVAWPAGLSTR